MEIWRSKEALGGYFAKSDAGYESSHSIYDLRGY